MSNLVVFARDDVTLLDLLRPGRRNRGRPTAVPGRADESERRRAAVAGGGERTGQVRKEGLPRSLAPVLAMSDVIGDPSDQLGW